MHIYTLKEWWKEAPSVRIFRFKPKTQKVQFLPGEFLFLHALENGQSIVKRPMSAASSPEEEELEFCIKMVGGELTSRLEKMEEGGEVGVERGGGVLAYRGEKRIGLISGGTGIAPMMSILRYASQKGADIAFFHSAREEKTVLYKKELEKFGDKAKIVITLTRGCWESKGAWICEEGRLNAEILQKHADTERVWFVCGPLGMCKAMKEALTSLGVPLSNIKLEGWG